MTTETAHRTPPIEDQIGGRHVSDLPDLLTIDELSNYLQVPKQTIYYWQKIGSGPKPFKLGKHLRWNKRALLDWLHQREVA
ncbi:MULTISPECIES: helix-turn-helix transcriptional regulator [Microbacterium]|uniref:Helix-turn-helix domain-containing protein n=1 Tax=Microbacterium profundi TaxID=450380 RepID=A0ABV3LKE3_9MICO|nr:helix-turn-helix domain-containing protein [Microbacterium profundi]MCE7483581.1 helix-turn-helix domain-containing protein [Microbacterium profundi]